MSKLTSRYPPVATTQRQLTMIRPFGGGLRRMYVSPKSHPT